MAQSDLRAYLLGATMINIGSSGAAEAVSAPSNCVGGFFKIKSGAGTLAIVTAGTSLTQGYLVGATEVVDFTGPAKFYLAATTATMVIQMVYAFGPGASLFP